MKSLSKGKNTQKVFNAIWVVMALILLVAIFTTGETDIVRQNTITGYVRIYTCVIVPLSIGLNVYFNKKKIRQS